MDDAVVQFSGVSKRFRIAQTHDTLRDLLTYGFRRLLQKRHADGPSAFWALSDVDFAVGRGEAVGIIGPNGAGKSTALKLLAGILRPDGGKITVRGRLAALIEVGAGFHGDLTGRENVFLNGAILGMGRREIRGKLDAIASFAGVEQFLDVPVKRYSSGMYARLGFSIAVHVEPEVLLVDEVLSVGDAVFRLRCLERMRRLVQDGVTVVFVTHDLTQMQSICPRAIVLDQGRIAFDGEAREAVGRYMNAMSRAFAGRSPDFAAPAGGGNGVVELLDLRWMSEDNKETVWIGPREEVRAEMTLRLSRSIRSMVVELNMRSALDGSLLSFNSGRSGCDFAGEAGIQRLTLTIPEIPLSGGQFFWNARIWDAESGTTLLDTPFRYPMGIDDCGKATGLLSLEHHWTLEAMSPESRPPSFIGNTVHAGGVCEDLSVR